MLLGRQLNNIFIILELGFVGVLAVEVELGNKLVLKNRRRDMIKLYQGDSALLFSF